MAPKRQGMERARWLSTAVSQWGERKACTQTQAPPPAVQGKCLPRLLVLPMAPTGFLLVRWPNAGGWPEPFLKCGICGVAGALGSERVGADHVVGVIDENRE